MDKMEPCPFCGAEPIFRKWFEKGNHIGFDRQRCEVECSVCSNWVFEEPSDAIAAWNTRAKTVPLSTQAALDCTIEHLDGIHEGKIVVDIDVFNTLYEAAKGSLE